MGFTFLPSEKARLVLGHLEEEKCVNAYNEFLETCKYLEECKGRSFLTRIFGMTLSEILDDYCAALSLFYRTKFDNLLKYPLKKLLSSLSEKTLDDIILQYENSFASKPSSPKIRRRSNSTSSISPIHSEKSLSPMSYKDSSCSVSCERLTRSLTDSTDLNDLPGSKKHLIITKNKGSKTSLVDSGCNSKLCKRKFNRSLDNLCSDKINDDENEIVFRNALGLRKNSDSLENNSKFPTRKKGMKPRTCSCSKKSNSTEIEPISAKVISNTLLDFPELHEKIADNINKIKSERSLSNKTDSAESKNISSSNIEHHNVSEPNNTLVIDESSINMDVSKCNTDIIANESLSVMAISNTLLDFPELHEKIADNINKVKNERSILNKLDSVDSKSPSLTKQDLECDPDNSNDAIPIDESSIMDIIKSATDITAKDPIFDSILYELINSVDNISGSDSDAVSRPDTSTPENHRNIFSKIDSINSKDNLIISSSSLPKKIQTPLRHPRGGKRMDLLQANYNKSANRDFKLKVPAKSSTSHVQHSNPPTDTYPSSKVVILSNERVQANFATNSTNENRVSLSITEDTTTSQVLQPVDKLFEILENNVSSNINLSDQNVHKVTGKPTELMISANGCNTIGKNEGNNAPSVINIIPTTEYEIINLITIKEDVTKNNSSGGFLRLIPPIQTASNNSEWIKYNDKEKVTFEYEIIDSKGLDVYPSEFSTSAAETNATVPMVLPISLNTCDATQSEHNIVKSIDTSNQDISIGNTVKLEDCIVTNLSDSTEKTDAKLNTPNTIAISKKPSSTPKKSSHIRILDFNTPEKSYCNEKQKSATVPKNPANRFKNNRLSSISKIQSKTCLFSPIVEERAKLNNDIGVSTLDSAVNPTDVKSTNINDSTNFEEESVKDGMLGTTTLPVHESELIQPQRKTNNTELIPKKNSWDLHLRAMLGEAYTNVNKSSITAENDKKKKSKTPKLSSKKTLKNDAKELENALNKSNDTPHKNPVMKPKIDKQHSVALMVAEEPIKDYSRKSDSSVVNILDDLDLSTNTTLEDSQSIAPNKNLSSDVLNISLNKTLKKIDNNLKRSKSDAVSVQTSVIERNLNSKNGNLLASATKAKKEKNPKSSKIKVKIGSKSLINKKNDESNTSFKSVKDKKINVKMNLNLQNADEPSKSSSEQSIPNSFHITPELPKEFRSNPIDAKCNLSLLLDTPLKNYLLDSTMATPRFLSPGFDSKPLSLVKFLDMPTPKFNNTPLSGNVQEVCSPGSYSSKITDYSSGSSYYKPDEVDMNSIPCLNNDKNKFGKYPKTSKKKTPLKSTKVPDPKKEIKSHNKKKTIKKTSAPKKKSLLYKFRNNLSTRVTRSVSLNNSNNICNKKKKCSLKCDCDEDATVVTKNNTSLRSDSSKKQPKSKSVLPIKEKRRSNSPKKKDILSVKTPSVSSNRSSNIFPAIKQKNDSLQVSEKPSVIPKTVTIKDNLFKELKNSNSINSPFKSKRKSSTPRKIYPIQSQLNDDFIDDKNVETFDSLHGLLQEDSTCDKKIISDTYKSISNITNTCENNSLLPNNSEPNKKSVSNDDVKKADKNKENVPNEKLEKDTNTKSLKNEEPTMVINDQTQKEDENEYLYITWSKHEGKRFDIVHNNSTLNEYNININKQQKSDLEEFCINLDVGTQNDLVRTVFIKPTQQIDLFSISPKVKLKDKLDLVKCSLDSNMKKANDSILRSGLQSFTKKSDSSASELSIQTKTVTIDTISIDNCSESETENAVKSILTTGEPIYDAQDKADNSNKDSTEKIKDKPAFKNKLEKRKRREEELKNIAKKSKCKDNTANDSFAFKNFDIEEVLSKLHGSET